MNKPQDSLPAVTLRIPGHWESAEHCWNQLPPGCFVKDRQLYVDDGPGFPFSILPADSEFPHVFRLAARRPATEEEQQRVTDYRMGIGLIGRGGSMDAARKIIRAGAAIIEAGGDGVFIDNSLMSHGAGDWLELHRNSGENLAVFYTFVNIVRRAGGIESHGMQALGRRDCRLELNGDETQLERDLEAFEDFLRTSCCEESAWTAHDRFYDATGREFLLEPMDDPALLDHEHPIVNPYGRWRMRNCSVET